jgi:aryl-alcohol dehydrogenase-like predicted oxidoreductase
VSVHSINFHSSLRNFRDTTLQALDQLLSALEAKYPDLLYVHDGDLYRIVTRGKFISHAGTVSVTAKMRDTAKSRSASWGAK